MEGDPPPPAAAGGQEESNVEEAPETVESNSQEEHNESQQQGDDPVLPPPVEAAAAVAPDAEPAPAVAVAVVVEEEQPPLGPVSVAVAPLFSAAVLPQQQHAISSTNAQNQLRQQANAVSTYRPAASTSGFGSSNISHFVQPSTFRPSYSHSSATSGFANAGFRRLGMETSSGDHTSNNNNNDLQQRTSSVPERNAEDSFSEQDDNNTTATNGWSEVELSHEPGGGGTPPSARSLHAAALLNGVMYVFGGYDGNQRVNTFHAFSFAEKRWSPVLPSANSPPPPSPRDRHVAVAFGNSFYIHGGFDGTARVSDFWAFDFSTMQWRVVRASQGRPPSPRHSHAAVVHNSSLYIFGGYDGSYKCDLHEFDFTTSSWSLVPAAGRRPRARYRATCVVHKNFIILYGGHDGTRHLSDTHIFDLETRTWNAVVCQGTPPIPRDSHVSVVHGDCMFVFGGSSGSAMNDLHELQIPITPMEPAKWRAVKSNNTSSSRTDQLPQHRFCHVAVVYNDSMFCFGGYNGADRLNDFIRFDFAVYDLSFEVPPSTILSDFRSLLNDSTLSDITFIVEEQPIYAHKLMLMRCSYFEALFLGQMKESSLDTIHLEQVRYTIFLSVLEYLYTDHVLIPLHDAMELFEAADLFCIPRLKTMCEKRMLQSISVESAASIFHAADMHSATALRQKSKKYILSHFEQVSKSPGFEEMGRRNIELVFELLQSR